MSKYFLLISYLLVGFSDLYAQTNPANIYCIKNNSNTGSQYEKNEVKIYSNPNSGFMVIQAKGLVKDPIAIQLFDAKGELIRSSTIKPGTTLTYIDTQTLYTGEYYFKIIKEGKTDVRNFFITF